MARASARVRWGQGQPAWPNGVKYWSEHLGHFKAGQPRLSLLTKSAVASPAFPPKLKLLGCDLAVRFVWFYCCVVFFFFFPKSSQCISAQKLFLTSSFEVEYSCERNHDLLAMTSVKNAASPSGVRLRCCCQRVKWD